MVTKEQLALVKPGMTRAQVRDVLGSPLLTDAFHADRWDYVFTIRRQGAEPQPARRIVARFEGETLKSVDSNAELPEEREFVASIDTFKTSRKAPPLALSEGADQGPAGTGEAGRPAAEPIGPTRSIRRWRPHDRRRAPAAHRPHPRGSADVPSDEGCHEHQAAHRRGPAPRAAWAAC